MGMRRRLEGHTHINTSRTHMLNNPLLCSIITITDIHRHRPLQELLVHLQALTQDSGNSSPRSIQMEVVPSTFVNYNER
jgi:hypothetical protein